MNTKSSTKTKSGSVPKTKPSQSEKGTKFLSPAQMIGSHPQFGCASLYPEWGGEICLDVGAATSAADCMLADK